MRIGIGAQQPGGDRQLSAMAQYLNRITGGTAADQRDLFIEKNLVGAHQAHSCIKRGRCRSLCHMWLGNHQVMGRLYTPLAIFPTQFGSARKYKNIFVANERIICFMYRL
jgi:hypothetical protein